MANMTFIWNNIADTATLSGGSWTRPLSSMQHRQLHNVARSTNVTTASTQFVIDLGVNNVVNYQAIGLLSHSFSSVATWRVRASDDVSFTTHDFDSGWVDVFLVTIPTPETLWEDDNWWTGKPSENELSGYSRNSFIFTDYLINSRYIKVEIDDSTTADAYVDIGRLFVARVNELLANVDFGRTIGWEDSTQIHESLGGVEFFENRTIRRVMSASSGLMTEQEALSNIYEMQKTKGISGEIFVMFDKDANNYSFKTDFLARMTSLSGISRHAHIYNNVSYEFRELK